jgi:hypothetical protein
MKEEKIIYQNLTDKQQESITIMISWLYSMWSELDIKNYYTIWNWLVQIKAGKVGLSSTDMGVVRELWDVYTEFYKQVIKDKL